MKLLDDIVDLLMREDGSLNEALLKTKVLLHKIGQSELVGWVNDEINGYNETEAIPSYRRLRARVMGNIFNGRFRYTNQNLPLGHLKPHIRDFLVEAPLGSSLGVLETLVGDGKHSLKTPTPAELLSVLGDGYQGGYLVESAWSQLEQSQVRQVLIEVRSRLLDFILALQSEIGETMSETEVKEAASKLDVPGMFHGAVLKGNVTVLVGNHNTQTVHITNTKGDMDALIAELTRNNVAQEDIVALTAAINDDPPPTAGGQYGPAIRTWIKRMLDKAIEASWNIELGVAAGLLTSVLQRYYGL
jgi:hypothetical protein